MGLECPFEPELGERLLFVSIVQTPAQIQRTDMYLQERIHI